MKRVVISFIIFLLVWARHPTEKLGRKKEKERKKNEREEEIYMMMLR